jgi:hypothetical protein
LLVAAHAGRPLIISKDQTGEQDAAVAVLRQRAPAFDFPPLARCHRRRKSLQSLFACRRPPPLRTPAGSQKNLTSPAHPYCRRISPAGAACLRSLINMNPTTHFHDHLLGLRYVSLRLELRVNAGDHCASGAFLCAEQLPCDALPPVHQCRVPHSRDPRELRPLASRSYAIKHVHIGKLFNNRVVR